MSIRQLTFLSTALLLLLCGCGSDKEMIRKSQTPLLEYLDQNGFTAFNPPRAGDGAGTIIQFNQQKQESIVFPASKCFPATPVPRAENKVALLETEYTLTADNKLELSLPQLTKYQINLAASIGSNGVKSVSIKFDSPSIQRITKGEAKDYVRTLPKSDSCSEEIRRDGNLVVHTVLGARGLEYTFNGEGGTKLAVTAEILNSMKASPSTSQQFKGAASMKFKPENFDKGELMLLGYRTWKASEVPGALSTNVEFVDLTQVDVQTLKK